MATKHGRQGMGRTGARTFPHRHGGGLLSAWKNDGYLLNTEERSGYLGRPINHRERRQVRAASSSFPPTEVWVPARGKCEPLATSYRCLIKSNELKYGQPRNQAGDRLTASDVDRRRATDTRR
ncbi:hypothetical protein TESG_08347 [Trichophyton tonsurans CBS 112818]|uniref:Uncharacterized protein n=1 Tax=Trichophyton tonsurans (strain CBS 112818) TaxID=647933 RepID=F2RTW2_TRIT1|nr:hypothetical protein TESG_08347 [Trichophyton tonsurans CBS 112818]